MKLILARHGETIENVKGIVAGVYPAQLSKKGKQQAKKLGKRLKNAEIDIIYSSDLDRAIDTAKAVAKYHKVEHKQSKLLRERAHGDWEGVFESQTNWEKPPKNFETDEQLLKRGKKILNFIKKNHKDQTVFVAGHSGINRAIVGAAIGVKEYPWRVSQINTCVNIITTNKKEYKVHLVNCTRHLE